MNRTQRLGATLLLAATAAAALAADPPVKPARPAASAAAAAQTDPLLTALSEELARSLKLLKGKPDATLYYLSYRLNDGQWFQESASFGALENAPDDDDPLAGRARYLDVSARVGSRSLDNT